MVEKSTILTNEIRILPAAEVDPVILNVFYKRMYPGRFEFLKENWSWLNRTSYLNNKVPLVIILENRVIAHAGLIPINITINNNRYSAAWFIDLAVLPEYRGHGFGSMLVKKREEMADIKMTFPNDNSCTIFKKFHWQESSESYMHYVLVEPFNHPKLTKWMPLKLRTILNQNMWFYLKLIYQKYAGNKNDYSLSNIDDKSLDLFQDRYKESNSRERDYFYPVRDENFVHWRIHNSPNMNNYFIYSCNNFNALIFMNEKSRNNIDVLCVSDLDNICEIRNMLSTLALVGKQKRYSFIRFFTTRKELSAFIKKSVRSVIKIRKFFYTADNNLLDECRKYNWDLELIDSDFEHTN